MAYFVVNSTWKKKDGDKVKVNKVEYEFGKNAFADIKTLLAKVQADEKATADLKVKQIEALVDAYVKANEADESFVKPTFDATNTKAAYYENNKAEVDGANVTATEALVDAYVATLEEKPVFDDNNTKGEYYAANEEAIDKWNNGWVDALVDAYVATLADDKKPTFDETNTKAAWYEKAENKTAVDTWNAANDKLRDAAMTDGIVLVDTTAEAIEIDVVGGKVVLDKTSLDEATLKYFADREINIDADGKSSLEVNGVVLPAAWDIEDVADVKIVEGGAVKGDITFEADKQTEYKYGKGETATTSLKSESIAAGGKIEIASKGYQVEVTEGEKTVKVDMPAAAEIKGYKTVNVKAGAYAGKISADEFSAKYAELDDKKNFAIDWDNVGEITDKDGNVTGADYNYDKTRGLMTEAKVTATGTVTLEENAVAESISGYKTVKLQEGAEIKGSVSSFDGIFDVNNANAVVIEDEKNKDGVKTDEELVWQDWAGDREVFAGGYTEVKIADKAVFEDKNVKGNTTITKKAAYNGQFTADEAAVEDWVANFATVKATDSVIKGGASVGATESVTEKYTYKTTKVKEASVYSAAYDFNGKSSATGSFTATGSTFGVKGVEGVANDPTTPEDETVEAVTAVDGSIKGYKTVKLTGSSIVNGSITGELNTSAVEKYESVPGKLVNAGGTTYEQMTVKVQARNEDGSPKFEADGVTPVMVEEQVDDYTKPIYGALSFAEDPTGMYNNFGISKKVSSTWKSAADGSVTVAVDKKNAADVEIAGEITNYAKVTLTGAAEKIVKVGGSVKSAVTDNDTLKDTTVFEEGNVKGNKNETYKDTYAGNFTATAAEVGGAVENFATVKVTDSVVKGSISVGNNSNTTEKYGYKTIKGKGEAPATYSATYDKTTKTSAAGSVTIADSTIGVFGVDDDPKTTDKDETVVEQKANIKGFKTVKLTNTSVNGAIEGVLMNSTNDKYESAKLINVGVTTYEQKTKMIPKVEDGVPVYVQEQAKDAEGNLLWVDEAKTVPQMTDKLDEYGNPIPVMVEEKDADGNVVTENDYTKPIYGVASFVADPTGINSGISEHVSWNSKTAAEGSVTVAVARKDAKEVVIGGAITNYLNVTLTGAVDKKSGAKTLVKVNGSVTGSETETSVGNDKMVNDDDAMIVKGSFTNNEKDVAAGAFKAVAAEIGGKIAGFKTVTLDNSVVTGSNGYDGIEADLNTSMVLKNTAKWKKGAAEGSVDMQITNTSSAVASLTATNSTIGVFAVADDPKTEDVDETVVAQNANISGFKTVKLTNTSVNGSITGASNDKSVVKRVVNFASYEDAKIFKAKTEEFESVVTNKADGKVTFKVDKNAAEDFYQVGTISNYKDVDIAGIAIKGKTKDDPTTIKSVVVKGSIVADDNFEQKRKYVVTPGYDKDGEYDYTGTTTDYDDDAKKLNFDKSTAVGSLKLAYADVEGGIYNFAKVTLTDSSVDGNVATGYNTVKTYRWENYKPAVEDDPATTDVNEAKDAVEAHEVALTDYNSVVGSLSMTNVDIDGQVSGFKTVDVKKGAEGFVNYFDSYKGLAVAEEGKEAEGLAATEKDAAETIKIAKGATLVTKYMDLQKEDKLVVDGSVIFQGAVKPAAKAVVGTESEKRIDIGAGAAEVTGKGTIYGSEEGLKSIGESFKGTKVNLGTTAENFWGAAVEISDNSDTTAKDFEAKMGGWLGGGFDFFKTENGNEIAGDYLDFVKFERADEAKSYTLTSEQLKGKTEAEALKIFNFSGSALVTKQVEGKDVLDITFNADQGTLTFKVAAATETEKSAYVGVGLNEETKGSFSYTIA